MPVTSANIAAIDRGFSKHSIPDLLSTWADIKERIESGQSLKMGTTDPNYFF
jgi:hypothetical protein